MADSMSSLPSVETIDLTSHQRPRRLVLEVLHDWVTTVDHKKIGLMYIGYALIFLVVGGVQALVMRIQLAVPHNSFVSPDVFNRLFTMHGTTMVFFMGMRLSVIPGQRIVMMVTTILIAVPMLPMPLRMRLIAQ